MRYQYLTTSGVLQDRPTGWGHQPGRSGPPASERGRGIPAEVIELVPESFVREHLVVPLSVEGETLTVAAADHRDIGLADKLSFLVNRKVRLLPAARDEVLALIAQYYGASGARTESVDSLLQTIDGAGDFEDRDDDAIPRGRAAVSRPSARVSPRRVAGSTAALYESAAWAPRPGAGALPGGLDPTGSLGDSGVFTYVVEEGQRALVRRPNGTMEIIVGPKRVWRGRNVFKPMQHFVAHPGDYLILRYRDGRQEHLPGPSEVWFDPRVHQDVSREEALQVAAKEAVVVYSSKEGTSAVQRRIEYGPTLFMPRPGEWLHTFAWHSSEGGSQGARKVAKGLVFQKLWLMPDQMYHDVPDVRTADDAVLTIRLMIFFELINITTMLDTTHDPIGDFVNAATSDVVDFTGRHNFESFKQNTDKLNELETYHQLTGRAAQCGYRINKVVYRGYGAPERLQQMHDQAIEARTKLQLERATQQQAQDLENFTLESQMLRAGKRRHEQSAEVEHELELARRRQEAALRDRQARLAFEREQAQLEADLRQHIRGERDLAERAHLAALKEMNVDLTAFLTQSRADRVIELRGPRGATHVHLEASRDSDGVPATATENRDRA